MDPPVPMDLDINISDGSQTEGSTHSMRGNNARRKVQKALNHDRNNFSWLLSQDSSSDEEMEYGDGY